MITKKLLIVVDGEVAMCPPVAIPESRPDALEKLNAIFSSNPSVMLTDDLSVEEGFIWNGSAFVAPEG